MKQTKILFSFDIINTTKNKTVRVSDQLT